jgi:hypothetical protein
MMLKNGQWPCCLGYDGLVPWTGNLYYVVGKNKLRRRESKTIEKIA